MDGAWKIYGAGAMLSAVLVTGTVMSGLGGSIQFSKAGDIVMISGQTNLAVGDKLLINVVSAGFTPTEKGTGGGFAGAAGTVVLQQGSPLNTYRFDVNVSTFPPGEYLVTVESVETGFRDSARFVLPWTSVPAEIPSTPAPTPAAITTPPAPALTTLASPSATPTPAPLSWIISIGALALAVSIMMLRR